MELSTPFISLHFIYDHVSDCVLHVHLILFTKHINAGFSCGFVMFTIYCKYTITFNLVPYLFLI